MKKSVKIILSVLLAVIVIAGVAGYALQKQSYHPGKPYSNAEEEFPDIPFEEALEQLNVMENRWQDASPQIILYNLIKMHFDAPLPEGKTEKKAIVIGYDGCRVDNLRLLENSGRSAINMLLETGGQVLFSYAGGAMYPGKNTQATSTAPGWCSMLTGVLADEHGVAENGIPKPLEPKTLLLSLVEDGAVNKSAFYVSWNGHFSKRNSTYINEKKYAEDNGVNAYFCRAKSDKGTIENILSDLNEQDCSGFIFSTLEFTDHAGHSSGFSLQNSDYIEAFYDAEASGADIIEAILNRSSYETEDWLILITTDHGGIGKNHGGSSFEERMTFIVSNKEIY
ncbi:MAG: alkaline phosphatase family protein [Oscillospiraceae bacterium]|nr:alkaline phosphatase family protein [Oscillospiraceae bacterium]